MPPKPTPIPPVTKGTGRLHKNTTLKQPIPVLDRLKRLFTSLCAQIEGGHFTNAIKTCEKILKLDPYDHDALQTKLFLLLQTDQYAAALSLTEARSGVSKGTGNEGNDLTFEKAYALYRLHREHDASRVLVVLQEESEAETDRGVLHLEAQLAYRQGNYQAASDLYNQLLITADPNSEEHSDILTNLEAAQRRLDFLTSGFLHALDALPSAVSSTLESVPPPVTQSHQQQQVVLVSTQTSSDAQKPRKVRMKRVPKGVVPGVTPAPDPERWLKKSERTAVGQGSRRRRGGGATQGAIESTGGAGGQKSSGAKGKKKK